jgi:hypothetical protein
MKTLFGWLVPSLFLVLMSAMLWMRVRSDTDSIELVTGPEEKQAREAGRKYEDAQDAQQPVTFAGPMANYMKHQDAESKVPDIESLEYEPTASDHVGGSVVGTSTTILQKTFGVTSTVQLPFAVPAHAYGPQLHGAFRSYLQGGKLESNPSKSDVEFLVLNDEEYTDLVNGHPSDAIFSCDATHDQEVNANLPPTLDQPVTYHLVFRNNTRGTQKKLVQAEFRIDY